ncbi:hypothetical protein [Nocardia mexicana]|uniref:Uncharacterized protein n=1 Tax=Nocardia mexicana TaxID=279262 RepID=A0A370GME2_9NOCA|nr:hypothetical protein [Nocardia mexicana]RDI43584.1 hypothetical protein DFR68_12051 [Nocardia mexicana]
MATGADTWWAQAAQDAGLAVWAYQPFPEQTAKFTSAQQREHARIREIAERVVVVGDRFAWGHFDTRDALMIDDAHAIIAVRDPGRDSGGTVSALARYCPARTVIKVNTAARHTSIASAYTHGPWSDPSARHDAVTGRQAIDAVFPAGTACTSRPDDAAPATTPHTTPPPDSGIDP